MDTEFKLTAEPGKREIVITCVLDAPRDIVFDAYVNPELLPQWWGPEDLTTFVERMDGKPGGSWRFIQNDSDGIEFAFHGVFHDVSRPKRIVQTFEFEGTPGHVLLETITFEDFNGRTKIVDQSVFQSVQDRDGMLGSGMEAGASESMSRFAELLKKMVKTV
jgi:uncharacterized protein YndB with AHSA1/START domain